MSDIYDGDREAARRARAEDAVRRGEDRPTGAGATPRIPPRFEERRGGQPSSGLGTAPTGIPSTSAPEEPAPTMPAGSAPGKAAAFGVIGGIILVIGLIALPFFVFSIVIAAPIALVVLIIAAALLATSRRGPAPPPER